MTMVGHETVREPRDGQRTSGARPLPRRSRRWPLSSSRGCARGRAASPPASSTTSAATRRPRRSSRSAKAAARHGGFYMTHVRDEADRSFEAFEEAVEIAAGGGSSRSRSPTSSWPPRASGTRLPGRSRSSTGRARRGRTPPPTAIPMRPGTPTWRCSFRTSSTTIRRASTRRCASSADPRASRSPRARRIPSYAGHNLEEIAAERRDHAGGPLFEDRQGGRRRHHRPFHEGGGRPRALQAALGHGRERRRHRQRPSPRRRDLPARARPLRPREAPLPAPGGGPQDDVAPGQAREPEGPRHDRARA